MSNNKILWEKLHKEPRYRPAYPYERVIQFVFGNFNRAKAANYKIFDFGCGTGRHLVFLSESGYRTYGGDISKIGIEAAKKFLTTKKLHANLQVIKDERLNYSDNYFDGLIGFGVLYYLSGEQLDRLIPEIQRILKKGGKALFTVRSKKDYRLKYAKFMGNGDYFIIGDRKSRVANEAGMLMHFFTEKEIKQRFVDFSNIMIDEMYSTYNNKEYMDHDYIIELTK